MKENVFFVSILIVFLFYTSTVCAADWDQLSIHGISVNTSLEEAEHIAGVKAQLFMKGVDKYKALYYKGIRFLFFDQKFMCASLETQYSYTSINKIFNEMVNKYGYPEYAEEWEGYSRTMCWGKCKLSYPAAIWDGKCVNCDHNASEGRCFNITIYDDKLTLYLENFSVRSAYSQYYKSLMETKKKKTWEKTKRKLDF